MLKCSYKKGYNNVDIKKMILPNILSVPPSGIRKIFDLASNMNDVISLNIGEPDINTTFSASNGGLFAIQKNKTRYTPNSGIKELRNEISKYIKRKYQTEVNPDNQIIVTSGASEAIDIALRVLVNSGDEVIIPEPNFEAYKCCTIFTGASPVKISLNAENGFKLTAKLVEQAISSKTKVLLLAYPNNPTGAVMNKDELLEIVNVLKGRDIIVISDEVYSEFTYTNKHVSLSCFKEIRDQVIVINSFSKTFSMTGWRIGYVWGHKEIIAAMHKIHQYANICAPTISQYAALEALLHDDECVKKMVNGYKKRGKLIFNGLNELGLKCVEPQGAFYAFPDIRCTGMKSDEFCEKLLLQEKVALVPGTAFGECGEGYVRACYASCSIEKICEALERIKKFIDRNSNV
jgi:aminotransferase